VAFSRDGKLLAVSQSNGEIILLDVETMRPLGKLPSAGGEGGRLAISSDNRMLAVVGGDGSVILWDVATRTQFGRPINLGSAPGPTGVAFSPDDRRVITGDANLQSLVAFDVNVESWIEQACDIAGRGLSNEERANYSLPPDGPRSCVPTSPAVSPDSPMK
jgi:WD40 repeat protein